MESAAESGLLFLFAVRMNINILGGFESDYCLNKEYEWLLREVGA